jgi:hypothetical protein
VPPIVAEVVVSGPAARNLVVSSEPRIEKIETPMTNPNVMPTTVRVKAFFITQIIHFGLTSSNAASLTSL